VTAFLVDAASPGYRIEGHYLPMSGQHIDNDIILENVRVPARNILGGLGNGVKLGMERININRLLQCPTMLGHAQFALEQAVDYANRRVQFNRPIANFQAIQHMLADMKTANFATQCLVDLGAEVIKIEEPKQGDPGRRLGKDMFARLNRNKRSLTLDLKSETGKTVLCDLLSNADAVIESFRPGVMDRLGFGYDAVCALNPAIVYCSLSGFGQTGPYRHCAGHEIDFRALSGYFAVPSQVRDKLARPKVRLSDYAGATLGAVISGVWRVLGF
jgi:hypothetical protein